MKRMALSFLMIVALSTIYNPVAAQSAEVQQLILNIEKLAQLRSILSNMYKGYTIITKGYNTIKDISSGNFNMHKLFLDGLMEVSPTVRRYYRIAEIISIQKDILQDYKRAGNAFRKMNVLQANDIAYIEQVHDNLIDGSLRNLEDLLTIITANKLRMSDAERLEAIDRIYLEIADRLNFLRHFNDKTRLLAAQRSDRLRDNITLQKINENE